MNKEKLEPLFVAPEYQPKLGLIEVLWRYTVSGMRNYRRKTGETYMSLTTFITAVESSSKYLQQWRESLIEELGSAEKVDEFVNATASYGTAGHELLAIAAREGKIDWDNFNSTASKLLEAQGLTDRTLSMALNELRMDTVCFAQFVHDYNVTILLVECPVWLDEGVATLIDIICEKDVSKYESTPKSKRKRHRCIINYKTGKKGFFPTHALQLEGERRMYNNVYGKKFGEITEVFNLAPTNWTTAPGYKLKDQTKVLAENNNRLVRLFDNFIQRAQIEEILGEPKTKFKKLKGITILGESPLNQLFFEDYGKFVEDGSNFDSKPEEIVVTKGSASTINKTKAKNKKNDKNVSA